MLQARWIPYPLHFTFRAGTSRGVMTDRDTYFLLVSDGNITGIGECSPLKGLSIDDLTELPNQLDRTVVQLQQTDPFSDEAAIDRWLQQHIPPTFPALRFGAETALLDLLHGGRRTIIPQAIQSYPAIPINGLVWMGEPDFMQRQLDDKLAQGFTCIKMKIGALNFDTELSLLARLRQRYNADQITLRVDANGAFPPGEALGKLRALSAYDIHSIEQPIAPGQPEQMRQLCQDSPIPIALDEELIGVTDHEAKKALLETIRPAYIILKPTLVGGLAETRKWIQLTESQRIGWWLTSALESNIGLNAIAQLAASYRPTLPQGLGTGQLYHNNIPAPMQIQKGFLRYDVNQSWDTTLLDV